MTFPSDQPFTVGNLNPRRQKLNRLKHTAYVTLPIVNEGDHNARFWLTGQGQTGHCRFEFEAPALATPLAPQLELSLAPGEVVCVKVWITVPPPPLAAVRRQKHGFVVTTTLMGQRQLSRSVLGWIETKALFDGWLISALLACLIVWLIMWGPSLPSPYPAGVTIAAPTPQHLPASDFAVPTPVYLAGNRPGAYPLAEGQAEALTYRVLFEEAAEPYQLDWRILAEVAYRESGFNPRAVGRQNEMGLMQIRPSTWSEWAPRIGVVDPYDPRSNVQVGAAYLAYLNDYSRAWGHTEAHWMLVGYNWGPSNLHNLFAQQAGWEAVPDRTRSYAQSILQFGPEIATRRQEQLDSTVLLVTQR